MSELLTICIPTYNRPLYLEACLQSILTQTFKDFRIVILDNASEIDYSEIISHFNDPRITYQRHSHNLGGTENINFAFREYSDKKYLIVFHDDDLMHPKLLEQEIYILEKNNKLVFVSTLFKGFSKEISKYPYIPPEPIVSDYDKSDLVRLFLKGLPIHFGSTMYRSKNLKGYNFDYDRFSKICDRPFLLDVLGKINRCSVISEQLVFYRLHPGQDSLESGNLSDANIIELFRTYREALKEQWNMQTAWLFYKTTGFELLNSYWRLAPDHREQLLPFLQKCRKNKIFLYPYIFYYFYGHLPRMVSELFRKMKHLGHTFIHTPGIKKK